MTVTVGLFEAKTHLSDLVARVADGGEDILITRRGKAVARLVPVESDAPVDEALALLLSARRGSSSGSESLRDLIDEGRRG